MRCDTCKASTCTGCGRKPNTKRTNTTAPLDLQICCDRGRLFGIWLALCQFDEYELESQVESQAPKAKAKKSKSSKAKVLKAPKPWADTGVGYDIGDSWDDDFDEIVPNETTNDTKVVKSNEPSDGQMTATLDILSRQLQTSGVATGSSDTKDEYGPLCYLLSSSITDLVISPSSLLRVDWYSSLSQETVANYISLDCPSSEQAYS